MVGSRVGGVLAAWCAANPRIRRAFAYELHDEGAGGRNGIHVLVDVEPVMESEEVLPVWLANADAWQCELQAMAACPVSLGSMGPYEAPLPGLKSVWFSEGMTGGS